MFSRPWTIAYSYVPETEGFELWEEAAYEGEQRHTDARRQPQAARQVSQHDVIFGKFDVHAPAASTAG